MRTNERKRSQINDLLIKPNTESTRVYPLKKIIVPFNFDKEKELSTKYTNIEQIMRDNIGINEKYRIHTSKDRCQLKIIMMIETAKGLLKLKAIRQR